MVEEMHEDDDGGDEDDDEEEDEEDMPDPDEEDQLLEGELSGVVSGWCLVCLGCLRPPY